MIDRIFLTINQKMLIRENFIQIWQQLIREKSVLFSKNDVHPEYSIRVSFTFFLPR